MEDLGQPEQPPVVEGIGAAPKMELQEIAPGVYFNATTGSIVVRGRMLGGAIVGDERFEPPKGEQLVEIDPESLIIANRAIEERHPLSGTGTIPPAEEA